MRDKILVKYTNKDERIFASSIIDKIEKFNKCNQIIYTNYLNLNEFNIATNILNKYDINYIYSNKDLERKTIILLPEYIEEYNFENISCIKITNKSKTKLLHKDYMGAIYNIGIAEDMIGDIIVRDNIAYIFLVRKVLDFILLNFSQVGNIVVEIEEIDKNICDISYIFEDITVTVASNRIDIILSHLYKLSRNEIDKKISSGDLVINSKLVKSKTYIVKENDIIAFKRCGKFKYIGIAKTTKTGNNVIDIKKYS